MSGYLAIHRPNAWVGRAVARKIHINGHLAGKVKNKSAAGFPIQPGVYRVTVGAGASKSQEVVVSVADNTYVNLVTTPNNTATVVNGVLGGCLGVGLVLAHRNLALIVLIVLATFVVSMVTWAVGRARPGLYIRLHAADSGPYTPMPMPYQPPQGPYAP